jgi:ferrous iron transport protein B
MSDHVFRRVAIAGNPNTGKSTIFNALTGLRQKVGNYPGVTVEKKTGRFFGSHGEAMELIDLPGSYSLQVRSPDEAVARDLLLGRIAGTERPDVIIAVVDASNLDRHLYLAAQMLELGIPLIVALNMVDVAEERGLVIDLMALKERLGVPVIPMVASKGTGLIELKQAVSRTPLPKPEHRAQLPIVYETEIAALAKKLPYPPETARLEAMLLLSLDEKGLAELREPGRHADVIEGQTRLRAHGLDPLAAPVDARYDWVGEICTAAIHRKGEGADGLTLSDRLDSVLTHKVWGWFAFLGLMGLMFVCIFFVAAWPMEWIEAGTQALQEWVGNSMAGDGDFESLLKDGIIGGVGGVVIFLPQILILFFFLGLLEDSGYMARAAFIMDRLMSRVGLHGKSFVPMLSSLACAIPGIMATRTIENRKDRLVTILVAPLMSCSARLPVYIVMIALMLPGATAWEQAGIMLSMYLLGFVAAFVMAWIFKKTIFRSETPMLLLELPPYRAPAMRGIVLRMWERGAIFLRRAGTVILALSIILWALLTYPKVQPTAERPEPTESEQLAHSYGGRMGHFLEPAITPLGYDWKIGISLVSSFAAREVFVSTMGQIYNIEEEEDEEEDQYHAKIEDQMRAEMKPDGTPRYTPLVCLSLMVFYVLAMQCLSTVAIVRRETGGWTWPLFQIGYMTVLAYLGALTVYQGGRLLGFH